MMVSRSSGLPRLVWHMIPVADREVKFRPRRAAALVLIVDPKRRERIDWCLVSASFGLTAPENGGCPDFPFAGTTPTRRRALRIDVRAGAGHPEIRGDGGRDPSCRRRHRVR